LSFDFKWGLAGAKLTEHNKINWLYGGLVGFFLDWVLIQAEIYSSGEQRDEGLLSFGQVSRQDIKG